MTTETTIADQATTRQVLARLLLTIDAHNLPDPTVVRVDEHGRVTVTAWPRDVETWRQALAPSATVHNTGAYLWFDVADWAPGWTLTVDGRREVAS